MHLMPDAKAISAIAQSIGATIGEEEAEQYRPYLIGLLRTVDQFMQERTVESPPPLLFPERGPGYRPGFAVRVLERAGAEVTWISVPEHAQVDAAAEAAEAD